MNNKANIAACSSCSTAKFVSGCRKSWLCSQALKIKASIIHLTMCSCFSKRVRVANRAKARTLSLTMGSTILRLVCNNETQAALKEDSSSEKEVCFVDPAAPPTLRNLGDEMLRNSIETENATSGAHTWGFEMDVGRRSVEGSPILYSGFHQSCTCANSQ
jgi:hypothetical protein